MDESITEKEENRVEDVLSSIESLEKNISRIKARLEEELLKKEKDNKESFQESKALVDDIILEYKKKLDDKEKELFENKTSIKSIVSEYDELLKNKNEYIKDLKKEAKFDNKIFDIAKKSEEMEKEVSVLNEKLSQANSEKEKIKEDYEKKLCDLEKIYKSKISEDLAKISGIASKKAAEEYKQKISDKNNELFETKQSVKTLVSEYDKVLKTKDEKLKIMKKDYSKEDFSGLKALGLPEEVILLSKEEILKKITEIIKENLILTKSNDSLKREIFEKNEDYNTTKKAYDKNIDSLKVEFSKLFEKSNILESNLKTANEKAEFLESELIKNNKTSNSSLIDLKKEYEKRINDLLSQKTKEQIDIEVSLNMLQKQVDQYQKTLSEKELRKEEFLREVEQMIKNTVAPKALDLLKNYESGSLISNSNYSENNEFQKIRRK